MKKMGACSGKVPAGDGSAIEYPHRDDGVIPMERPRLKIDEGIDQEPERQEMPIPQPGLTRKELEQFVVKVDRARVVEVYDGDTIHFAFFASLGGHAPKLYRYCVRVKGIDTPEMKGKGVGPNEKQVAQLAKEHVIQLCHDKIILMKNHENDKYGGRVVADVFVEVEGGDPINLAQSLVDNRLAVPYDGGRKNPPEDWLAFYEGV